MGCCVRQALLRQGREFAEVLVECPVVDHREALPDDAARNRRRRGAIRAALGPGAGQGAGGPATVARGTLVLRLINIGRAVRALLTRSHLPLADRTHTALSCRLTRAARSLHRLSIYCASWTTPTCLNPQGCSAMASPAAAQKQASHTYRPCTGPFPPSRLE